MQTENKFALIGRTLKHSYSKVIHSMLGKYCYDLVELESDQLKSFIEGDITGFNVTIPYKTEIMQYLDEIDVKAKEIGAVNTVIKRNGKTYGYNTDFDGMLFMLKRAGIVVKDKTVMILGTGGTSKTATAVMRYLGAKIIRIVGRNGEINYSNCKNFTDTQVIINTTPVGTYPDNYSAPLSLVGFPALEGVVDVIYNPTKTKLCFEAEQLGIKNVNGLAMLVAQAKYASEKFMETNIEQDIVEHCIEKLNKNRTNVVLIGMPGSGKSSIGVKVAELLKREFIDTDQEIVKRAGKDIPTIFKEDGEECFRELESQVLKDVCALTGKVIATGGGVVKNEQNLYPVKSNGKVFYIKRDVEKLVTVGRPLSKDLETVRSLYKQRKERYELFSDFEVDNNSSLENAVKGVVEKL